MREIVRIAALGLITGTTLVLMFHAPGPVWREIQFLSCILLATVVTRSMSAGSGLSALGLGLGPVVFLAIGAGRALTAAGFATTTSGFVTLVLFPIVEETLKLAPIAIVMWLHARRHGLTPNPSDLLMLGCFAGAGFALAENVTLAQNNAAAAVDMARQYGPSLGAVYFVPGAWGSAGYVGHAAATGFIAGGYGLGLALRDRLGDRWWLLPAGCAAWVLLEHILANVYVGSGSRYALLLANGRITPWLFVMMLAAIAALDYRRRQATLARSANLRVRRAMTRAALVRTRPPVPRSRINAARLFMSQLRLINAAAWFVERHGGPVAERAS